MKKRRELAEPGWQQASLSVRIAYTHKNSHGQKIRKIKTPPHLPSLSHSLHFSPSLFLSLPLNGGLRAHLKYWQNLTRWHLHLHVLWGLSIVTSPAGFALWLFFWTFEWKQTSSHFHWNQFLSVPSSCLIWNRIHPEKIPQQSVFLLFALL